MSTIHQTVGLSLDRARASPRATTLVECDVARVFAAAANSGTTVSSGQGRATVTVQLTFPQLRDSPRARDVCLLCVDRALTRIAPPLDPLQYLTASSPRFESGPLRLVFDVVPSRAFTEEYPWKDASNTDDADDNAVHHHKVDGDVVSLESFLSAAETDAGVKARRGGCDAEAPSASAARREDRIATEATDALWVAAVTNKFSQLSGESMGKARRFHWRLAYWCAERFINEASWAKLSVATKAGRLSSFTPLHKTVLDAALALSESTAVANKNKPPASTSSSPANTHLSGVPRVTHADVRGIEFDGLIVAHTQRYAYIAVPYVLNASAADQPRRVLWTLVARVPIPGSLDVQSASSVVGGDEGTDGDHDNDNEEDGAPDASSSPPKDRPSAGGRKRPRTAAHAHGEETAGTPTHFYNTTEALLHDHLGSFVELPNAAKRAVTVCVHRAHCKASRDALEELMPDTESQLPDTATSKVTLTLPPTCPLRFSVWLEDASLVACQAEPWSHPQMTSAHALPSCLPSRAAVEAAESEAAARCDDDGDDDSKGAGKQQPPTPPFDGLNTFADLLGALSDSCTRYVRNGEKFVASAQPPQPALPAASAAAAAPTTVAPDTSVAVEDEVETASVGSTTAVVGDDAEGRAVPPVPTATPKSTTDKAVDDESVWRRNAVRKALTLFTALTDTTSVYFKKLRRHQLPPGAMHAPKMERWQDASGLTESCNIEFKYRLSQGGTISSANVDRIRHTLAAMASTQGGVVLVGVTDRGDLVGHERGAVLSHLRTTGFCPAMVKDSVTVKELRAPLATRDTASSPSTEAKRAMPANWWKGSKTQTTSDDAATDAASAPSSKADAASQDVVITAVTVQRGQAPFYTAARNAAPYVRTCASSTLMPVHTMALRILNHIAFGA